MHLIKHLRRKSSEGRNDELLLGQKVALPRGSKFSSLDKNAGARQRVRLASGETNICWQITRSVICFNMGEQLPTTAVHNDCRPSEPPYDTAMNSTPRLNSLKSLER